MTVLSLGTQGPITSDLTLKVLRLNPFPSLPWLDLSLWCLRTTRVTYNQPQELIY